MQTFIRQMIAPATVVVTSLLMVFAWPASARDDFQFTFQPNLRDQLQKLEIPTLGIYDTKDNIVSPNNANLLKKNVKSHHVTMMSASRHFPMIDEPEAFMRTLDEFLANQPEEHLMSKNGN